MPRCRDGELLQVGRESNACESLEDRPVTFGEIPAWLMSLPLDRFHAVWRAVVTDSVIEGDLKLNSETTLRIFCNTLNAVAERYGHVPRPSKWMPKDGPGKAGPKPASSPRFIRFADDSGND